MADINARLQDSPGGIRVVKPFGNERWRSRSSTARTPVSWRLQSSAGSAGSFRCGELAVHRRAVHGDHRAAATSGVATGGLQVTDLAIHALYIGIFISPIEQLINPVETFRSWPRRLPALHGGAQRGALTSPTPPDAMDLNAAERACCGGPTGTRGRRGATGDAHSVRYDGVHEVLRGLTGHTGGTTVAPGPSGGGSKTTTRSLTLFLRPGERSVEIDGIDVRSVTVESQRCHRHRAAGRTCSAHHPR